MGQGLQLEYRVFRDPRELGAEEGMGWGHSNSRSSWCGSRSCVPDHRVCSHSPLGLRGNGPGQLLRVGLAPWLSWEATL